MLLVGFLVIIKKEASLPNNEHWIGSNVYYKRSAIRNCMYKCPELSINFSFNSKSSVHGELRNRHLLLWVFKGSRDSLHYWCNEELSASARNFNISVFYARWEVYLSRWQLITEAEFLIWFCVVACIHKSRELWSHKKNVMWNYGIGWHMKRTRKRKIKNLHLVKISLLVYIGGEISTVLLWWLPTTSVAYKRPQQFAPIGVSVRFQLALSRNANLFHNFTKLIYFPSLLLSIEVYFDRGLGCEAQNKSISLPPPPNPHTHTHNFERLWIKPSTSVY